ncbi:MAG: tRNA 2-thiouridine(34) synthase MnmA [Firmicutes bacterium]|nr:tRNA 2-thiouridine(34) synthase MnmA [Bacillota bacterium]
MRVLVAMSGGVDSSVAVALLSQAGHDVVGATMRLWGGASDSGCCQVTDVIDARRVCDSLGVEHLVFDMTEEFERAVVDNFSESHQLGLTPNPCVECNRHLKFKEFMTKAQRLGFDRIATGHHVRLRHDTDTGKALLLRGLDRKKDQSYVLSVLSQEMLSKCLFPIGEITKEEVRQYALKMDLRTASKPDSQDLCFVSSRNEAAGRGAFLKERIVLHKATLVEEKTNTGLGEIEAMELLTVGQRKGLSFSAGVRKYVTRIDIQERKVFVGSEDDLLVDEVELREKTFTGSSLAVGMKVEVQVSAHGKERQAIVSDKGIIFKSKSRKVAPGQIVAIYDQDRVLGSGVAC